MIYEAHTYIEITSDNNDFVDVIKFLLKYVKMKKNRIERIVLDGINDNKPIDSLKVSDLKNELNNETHLTISFEGPFGETSEIDEDMFIKLAKATPSICFKSATDASTDYNDESLECTYSNKELVIIRETSDNDDYYDAYRNYLSEKIKYERFIELFCIEKSCFSEQDYIDMFFNIDTDIESLYSSTIWYLNDENIDFQDPGEDRFNSLLDGVMNDIDFGEFEFDGTVITKTIYTI